MKFENQLTSLALSKRLKELGVKQESIFYWDALSPTAYIIKFFPYHCPGLEHYSAFTVAELGELLPGEIEKYRKQYNVFDYFYIRFIKNEDQYFSTYYLGPEEEEKLIEFKDHSEANVRALMLIYLIENGLLKNE